MEERTRSRLANALLALGSVLLTLLVLEGAFRVAGRFQGGGKEEGTIALYTEHDPLLGWRKKPGARATFHRREYTVEVVVNGHGLRDKERGYEALPGTFRILALGDSLVEAYSVPLEASLTQLLEGSLSSAGCPVEVINGGTAAYSTDQEYLFYRTEGARYSPRIVILFFLYNDVLFNASASHFGTPKPLLTWEEGGPKLSEDPVPAPPAARGPMAEAAGSPRSPAGAQGDSAASVSRGSALRAWLTDRMMRGSPRAYDDLAAFGLWPRIRVIEPHLQLKVYKRRLVPEIEKGWESTERILEALMREVEARGSRLLVVYAPSRMEVSDRDWQLTQIRYGMDEERWDRGLVLARLREIAASVGFPLLDLTPSLRAADRGLLGGPYYVHDGHWNARGHAVAAREIEAFLRQRGWLTACAASS